MGYLIKYLNKMKMYEFGHYGHPCTLTVNWLNILIKDLNGLQGENAVGLGTKRKR